MVAFHATIIVYCTYISKVRIIGITLKLEITVYSLNKENAGNQHLNHGQELLQIPKCSENGV
jgi:hypothetical protein